MSARPGCLPVCLSVCVSVCLCLFMACHKIDLGQPCLQVDAMSSDTAAAADDSADVDMREHTEQSTMPQVQSCRQSVHCQLLWCQCVIYAQHEGLESPLLCHTGFLCVLFRPLAILGHSASVVSVLLEQYSTHSQTGSCIISLTIGCLQGSQPQRSNAVMGTAPFIFPQSLLFPHPKQPSGTPASQPSESALPNKLRAAQPSLQQPSGGSCLVFPSAADLAGSPAVQPGAAVARHLQRAVQQDVSSQLSGLSMASSLSCQSHSVAQVSRVTLLPT